MASEARDGHSWGVSVQVSLHTETEYIKIHYMSTLSNVVFSHVVPQQQHRHHKHTGEFYFTTAMKGGH